MTSSALVGVAMITTTIVIDSVVIAISISAITLFGKKFPRLPTVLRTVLILCPLSIWLLFAGIGSALWLWSTLLVELNEFSSQSDAMYFTSVTATTLGYGDTLLSNQQKLLSGFIAANGLFLFSLNTAVLFEALRRINDSEV